PPARPSGGRSQSSAEAKDTVTSLDGMREGFRNVDHGVKQRNTPHNAVRAGMNELEKSPKAGQNRAIARNSQLLPRCAESPERSITRGDQMWFQGSIGVAS